jgi:hypothetical protein
MRSWRVSRSGLLLSQRSKILSLIILSQDASKMRTPSREILKTSFIRDQDPTMDGVTSRTEATEEEVITTITMEDTRDPTFSKVPLRLSKCSQTVVPFPKIERETIPFVPTPRESIATVPRHKSSRAAVRIIVSMISNVWARDDQALT